MKKALIILILSVLVIGLVLSACTSAPPEAIELKVVAFKPAHLADVQAHLQPFIDIVNERSDGEIIVSLLGGPEIVPGFDLASAIQEGTVDIGWLPMSFYEPLVGPATPLVASTYSPQEEREMGIWDMVQEQHSGAGLYWLGRGDNATPWDTMRIFSPERFGTPQELVGKKIAMEWMGLDFLDQGLNVVPVSLPSEEWYTSLEQGVVDGGFNPLGDILESSYHEVTNYIIDHGFGTSNVSLTMNLDTWNSLTKKQQDLLTDTVIELETQWRDWYVTDDAVTRQTLVDSGMQLIQFSAEDARWYRETGVTVELARFAEDSPQLAAQYDELVGR